MHRGLDRRSLIVVLGVLMTLAAAACGDDNGKSAGSDSTTTAVKEPQVVQGAGDIGPKVEDYRSLLGPNNGAGPERHVSGRREISWDGVPDASAEPNALPSDFFNGLEAPRARGAVLTSPGAHVAVSADGDNPSHTARRFGDLNPTYAKIFRTFSQARLFSPIGSNIVDLRFYVPGTSTPAAVRGFGAVYTDVDRKETASFKLFTVNDKALGQFPVPTSKKRLSFLGIAYRDPIVTRVRIVYGNHALGPNDDKKYDVAVMDDFIYGEPQPLKR